VRGVEKEEPKPSPSKDLLNILEFEEAEHKEAEKPTQLLPDFLGDNEFGNFASAPPEVKAVQAKPLLPQCLKHHFDSCRGGKRSSG